MVPVLSRKALKRLLLYLVSLAVVITALAIIAAFLREGSPNNSARGPVPQLVFVTGLEHNLSSFDSGVLEYSRPGKLTTASRSQLTVRITDVGRYAPSAGLLPSFPGWVVDKQDVPTGGIIGVTAFCADLECVGESPTRQAVLPGSQPGRWTWALSPVSPGSASITITVTTYSQNTNVVLHVTGPIQIAVPVQATLAYRVRSIFDAAGGLLRWIGSALIVAGIAALWRLRQRRHHRTPESLPHSPVPAAPPPAEPSPAPPAQPG